MLQSIPWPEMFIASTAPCQILLASPPESIAAPASVSKRESLHTTRFLAHDRRLPSEPQGLEDSRQHFERILKRYNDHVTTHQVGGVVVEGALDIMDSTLTLAEGGGAVAAPFTRGTSLAVSGTAYLLRKQIEYTKDVYKEQGRETLSRRLARDLKQFQAADPQL